MRLYRCACCGESMTDLVLDPLADLLEAVGHAWCYTCQANRPIVPAAEFGRPG